MGESNMLLLLYGDQGKNLLICHSFDPESLDGVVWYWVLTDEEREDEQCMNTLCYGAVTPRKDKRSIPFFSDGGKWEACYRQAQTEVSFAITFPIDNNNHKQLENVYFIRLTHNYCLFSTQLLPIFFSTFAY